MKRAIGIGILSLFAVPTIFGWLTGAGLWALFAAIGLTIATIVTVGAFVGGIALATSSGDPDRLFFTRIRALVRALSGDKTTSIRRQ